MDLADWQINRFWKRVDRSDPNGCWPWLKSVSDRGYGRWWNYETHLHIQAHRIAYEIAVGPIPEGLQLDHLCHSRDLSCRGGKSCLHRRCVNPAHLEPVTMLVNIRRGRTGVLKTHCKHGHAFTPANTYQWKSHRYCRTCHAVSVERRKARLAQEKEGATL